MQQVPQKHAHLREVMKEVLQENQTAALQRERELGKMSSMIAQGDSLTWILGPLFLLALCGAALYLPELMHTDDNIFDRATPLMVLWAAGIIFVLVRRMRA